MVQKVQEHNTIRFGFINVAKGIGIICVMLGHLGNEMIDRVVFTFHMPLFFLISGYFLNDSVPILEFIKKKAKRLLLPYYVTGGSICILLVLADIVRGLWGEIPSDFFNMIIAVIFGSCFDVTEQIHGIGAIWFLWALFWAALIVRLSCKLKWRGAVWISLLALVSYVSYSFLVLPLSVQPGCCAAIFVYLGWKLKIMDLKRYITNTWLMFFALGIFVLEVALEIRVDMAKNMYKMGIVSVLGAVFICFFVLYVSNIIYSTTAMINKGLCFLGKHSLIVLCFHQIEMRVFPWSIVKYFLESVSMIEYFNCVVIIVRFIFCTICTVGFVYIVSGTFRGKLTHIL